MKVEETKQKIIENSKSVFIKKGLKNVTMTDLVEVSGYSRGGVYRYFKKPEEIFSALMRQETKSLKEDLTQITFEDYLALEEEELLNINNTLSLAGYEFMTSFSDSNELGTFIFETHVEMIEKIIGCSQVEAQKIFITLEGLRAMALAGILTEEIMRNMFKTFTD
ncbi:TetR/AcrR family transcriptional regulator [Vagococcus carniphilus]|uniref:TetR/AcrR family transcriptional regulator n=1 Tax=Vagococcus carniphilus TaxID=218144 RepID=UPI003B59AC24